MNEPFSSSKRRFLSLLGRGSASMSLAPLAGLYAACTVSTQTPRFGNIRPKRPKNSEQLFNDVIGDLRGKSLLALPDGFEYSVISPTGDALDNKDQRVPSNHDGMAAFRGKNNTTILVRNHELDSPGAGGTRCAHPSTKSYDDTQSGGTTTLILDQRGNLLSHKVSLAGTSRNCAGGPTPWSSWLSCEETFSEGDTGIRHGYVFEVPAHGEASMQPLKGLGRFSHEAAAIDPASGDVYLTEDRPDSLLYRFRPSVPGNLNSAGTLEALKLSDFSQGVDTAHSFSNRLFEALPVQWVRIEEEDPATERRGNSTRAQGQSKGAARFARGEGAWWGNDRLYFSCTSGGASDRGQIFALDPLTQELTLMVEAVPEPAIEGKYALAAPDNLTVGPDGCIYICEDGAGLEKIVGLNADGTLFEFARNIFNDSETAGICFSPDGKTMFVNIQYPGLTCVIRGPWT